GGHPEVNADLVLWDASRAAAMSAFFVLALSLVTGMALRTSLFAGVARNRAVLDLHAFLAWFWVPLVAVHVVSIVLDPTSRVGWADLAAPFQVGYARVAIGIGTVGFLLLVLVGVTSAIRRRMNPTLWRALHRLGYVMFVLFLVHAQLAGSDFSRTPISVAGWATVGMLVMLALPRAAGGRVENPAG
ncbi:MAG TPA: ferric reductase-like transmembrane domain-containing protein, partial [Candidatus Dormibacteraeota bacterium]|nr:ferric reductase-like transmembrane domain-containing protein [Candidatus Dormibacteraeota bacterium]